MVTKVYAGWMDPGRNAHVTVNGTPLRLVEYHGDTFSWGYQGSGPATLALSILADHFGETHVDRAYLMRRGLGKRAPQSWHFHQAFKRAFVARWREPMVWTLTSDEITAWLALQPPYGRRDPEMEM